MFYKIGICDDDKCFLDTLEVLLREYEQLHSLDFQIFPFASGEELLDNYDNQHFNLLFLDMEMNELSGIDVAERLRQAGDDIAIIYTTAYEGYALQAFQVGADSYLVKPIVAKSLAVALDRIFHTLNLQATLQTIHKSYIALESDGDIIQLAYDDIRYLSKARNTLTFYTTTGEHRVYMNIKDILAKLDSSLFVKINQGQVINWSKVTSLNNDTVFLDDIELAISRSNISRLNKRYRQELEQLLRIKETAHFS